MDSVNTDDPVKKSLQDGGRQEAGEELADMATSGPKRNVNLPIFFAIRQLCDKTKILIDYDTRTLL